MAYIVNRTDGNIAAVVNDGVIDTTTSLNLVGKGYPNYAETIAEDFVAVLENFANVIPPRSPLPGQIWYNKSTSQLNVYDGIKFGAVNNVIRSASAPTNPSTGDFWYDTAAKQLKFYKEGVWQLIAPAYNAAQGRYELVVETFYDTDGDPKPVVVIYTNSKRAAVISDHNTFQTYPYVTGYQYVYQGINLPDNSVMANARLIGLATFAETAYGLDPVSDATYMHANANTSTVGTLTVVNDGGITIGGNADISVSIDSAVNVMTNVNKQFIIHENPRHRN